MPTQKEHHMLKKLTFTASTLVFVGAAFAQTAVSATTPVAKPAVPPVIDARQAHQEQRIEQGLQSGRLTQAEATRLQKGEAHIDSAQARARADGKVTLQERHRLDKMTDRESVAIRRQKHDRQNDRNHDGQPDRHQGGQHKS